MAEHLSVECRPARPEDKAAVLQMVSRIWEGEDYIPYVWDEWIADPEGHLAVAEAGGQIVGMAKLSKMGPGEWLLAGLRTHPDLEGRGVASQVHHYMIDLWEQTGDGILRLLTSAKRLPVHHLAAKTGFKHIAEFTAFQAPPLSGEAHAFVPLQPGEVEAALEFVQASPLLPLQSGLMDLDWSFVPPNAGSLQEAVQAGNAFWWLPGGEEAGRQGFLSAYEEFDERQEGDEVERRYKVQLLACGLEDLSSLLKDFRRLAGERGFQYAGWMAGFFPDLQPGLQAAGFERSWDSSLYVFAKAHPKHRKPR